MVSRVPCLWFVVPIAGEDEDKDKDKKSVQGKGSDFSGGIRSLGTDANVTKQLAIDMGYDVNMCIRKSGLEYEIVELKEEHAVLEEEDGEQLEVPYKSLVTDYVVKGKRVEEDTPYKCVHATYARPYQSLIHYYSIVWSASDF